jgi:uncharacterized membrane protein
MVDKRTLSLIIIVVGLIVAVLSLTADITGLGAAPGRFGYKQITGTVIGIIMMVVGVFLRKR